MYLHVEKTLTLNGKSTIPGSKSHTIRALLLALLAKGKSTLTNSLHSDDSRNAMEACRDLGAIIDDKGETLTVDSNGLLFDSSIKRLNTGSSGVTTHFILPLLGLRENTDQAIILDCSEQMRSRPVHSLVNALIPLGLNFTHLEKPGSLPVSVTGTLKGGVTEVSGITSQYLSALLVALPCAMNDSVITVKDLQERPYADMTLNWLTRQGIQYSHEQAGNVDTYRIKGGQEYKNFNAAIPGDFSTASYLITAAALFDGQVELDGLDMSDPQGDKMLVDILKEMGADIQIKPNSLIISGGKPLKGISINASDIPDLLPVLAVIGTYASGKTEITHVKHARIKETDRITSMTEGLRKMGATVEENENGMVIHQSRLTGAQVKGYADHRTVMALTIAGMLADGNTVVDDAEAVSKTFPDFADHMTSLGANVSVSESVLTSKLQPRPALSADEDSKEESVQKPVKKAPSFVLVGLPGAGKSSVIKEIHNKLQQSPEANIQLISTDSLIRKRCNSTDPVVLSFIDKCKVKYNLEIQLSTFEAENPVHELISRYGIDPYYYDLEELFLMDILNQDYSTPVLFDLGGKAIFRENVRNKLFEKGIVSIMLNVSHETIMQHLNTSEGYGNRKMYQLAKDPEGLVSTHRQERLNKYAEYGVIAIDIDEINGNEEKVAREVLSRIAELQNIMLSRRNRYLGELGNIRMFDSKAQAAPIGKVASPTQEFVSQLKFKTNGV